MLLDTENRNVTTMGVMQVSRATIKTSPKIFNFFSDNTYANKPKAICRELVANAVDSHVMAGRADTPVEVWLPTLLNPTFAVRDTGLGMSKLFLFGDPANDIPSQFMCFADGSTKDGSNEAVGGFGIGSKSPFAYVDQFTVVSRFDGMEYVGSIFKDEDGIPAIGLLGERPTTEPNGVEFSFPVKEEDFGTFEKAAFDALQYFQPLPLIKNAAPGKELEAPEYIARGNGWAMRPAAGDLAVIMGGVRYPVAAGNLTYRFGSDTAAYKLLRYGLDITLPIGSCSIALSREALSYDDRTIEALKLACENVVDEVAESFAYMFDHFEPTQGWVARVALYKEVGPNSHGERGKFLAEHAKWHGEPFSTTMDWPRFSQFACGYQTWGIAHNYDRRGKKGSVRPIGSAQWAHPAQLGFMPGTIEHLIIDDLPQAPKYKAVRKIKEFVQELSTYQQGKVLVVRPFESLNLTAEQILAGFGNPPAIQVVLTSTLPEPIMERAPRSAAMINRPRVRMFTFDGSQQKDKYGHYGAADNINPENSRRRGVREIPYMDQPDSGILVVMDKFCLPGGLWRAMQYGLIQWNELRFVNSSDAKKLAKANWTDWNAEFETRKKVALSAYPELAARMAVAVNDDLSSLFRFFRDNPTLPDIGPRSPLGKIREVYRRYVQPLTDDQRKLSSLVTPKMPANLKPAELREQFETKQWKAHRLIGLLGHNLDAADMKLLMENL